MDSLLRVDRGGVPLEQLLDWLDVTDVCDRGLLEEDPPLDEVVQRRTTQVGGGSNYLLFTIVES